jgi:hypothetical protein
MSDTSVAHLLHEQFVLELRCVALGLRALEGRVAPLLLVQLNLCCNACVM